MDEQPANRNHSRKPDEGKPDEVLNRERSKEGADGTTEEEVDPEEFYSGAADNVTAEEVDPENFYNG